jgi:NADPH-dependent 2,4-dienoyl-CoA reductase/sulfur reductase-like enzyme
LKRRRFLATAAALPLLAGNFPRLGAALAQSKARVVVVGGGFAGASCARALRRAAPDISVTLVAAGDVFTACPHSNAVVAGLRELSAQQFRYGGLRAEGVTLARGPAAGIDPKGRFVTAADGSLLPYDRLVVAPGIAMRWNALPGYDEAAAQRLPHAWIAGEQTMLLRKQLEAMPEGGLVAIAVPAYPYRCPTAPYERASLIAHFLKARKPRSKLLILDSKDGFTQQRLFERAWEELYPGLVEWVALSQGGAVTKVDAAAGTLETDFDQHHPAVANVIPPQKAGRAAELAGAADATGWCPVDPLTFESKLQPGVHVIGDAAIAGAMPKSAFAASSQGKACAAAVAALLAGRTPAEAQLFNACYSLLGPEYGISQSASYHLSQGQIMEIAGSGRTSELEAPRPARAKEAAQGEAWFRSITGEAFG